MPDPSQEQVDKIAAEMQSGIGQSPTAQGLINEQPAQTIQEAPSTAGGSFDLSMIDQVTNPGASQQDLDAIAQANSMYDTAPQMPVSQVTAVGDPGTASLMPTLNQPINVGTSSGQITGSHGVYVNPGFVAPWGAFMDQQKQRQVAQQEQDKLANLNAKERHLAKQAKDKAFQFSPEKLTVKDPGFQKSLNEAATSFTDSMKDQAKQLYGKDWQVALKTDTRLGREFQAGMDGLNVMVRNADRATEKFAEIEAGEKSGDVYYTDEVRQLKKDYEQMTSEAFKGGDFKKLAGIRQLYKDLDGAMELNTFLQDKGILSNIKGQISGSTGISDMGEFMKLKTSDRTTYDKNISAIVQNVRKSMGTNYPYTDEDIENALRGHLQNKSTSKSTITKKDTKGGGRGISKENISLTQGSKPIQITYNKGLDKNKNPITSTATFIATTTQPIPTSEKPMDAIGMQFINEAGEKELQPNVGTINPVEAQVIEYTDRDGNARSRRVVVVTETREEPIFDGKRDSGRTKTITNTHLVDYDSNKDRWTTELGKDFNDAFGSLEVNPGDVGTGEKKRKAAGKRGATSEESEFTEADYNKLKKGDTYTYKGETYTKE